MSATTVLAGRYMKLYVYLPLALRPDARDALLISFGVGSTAKALTDSADLRRIDVVDISRDILELSSVVYAGADNPLRDDRVRVHVEDGTILPQHARTQVRLDHVRAAPAEGRGRCEPLFRGILPD